MTTQSGDVWDNLDKRLSEGREKTAKYKRIAAAERAVIQAADTAVGQSFNAVSLTELARAVNALREARK